MCPAGICLPRLSSRDVPWLGNLCLLLERWGRVANPQIGSAPSCSGPAPAWPGSAPLRGARTLVLILDGEAEDVARAETRAVIHASVEKRVCVCVRDVQDLACSRHVARYALVGRDAYLITLPGQAWVGRKTLVTVQGAGHQALCRHPTPRTRIHSPRCGLPHLVVHHTSIEHLGHQLILVQQEHGAAVGRQPWSTGP